MEAFDWPDRDASVWFVLTGEAPEVRPLDGRWVTKQGKYLNPQWRIQLTIPRWVPAEEVLRAYQILRGQDPRGRELPNKTTSLELARFVWEQERLHGCKEPTPWSAFFERWNEQHPGHRFKSYSNFRTYFFRGDAAVKELNFNWPQPRVRESQDE